MSEFPLHLLARHGQTEANAQGVFRGRMDSPLDAKGVEDAHQAAQWVAKRMPVHAILSSPLHRAVHTAAIYGQHLGLRPQIDEKLLPWDSGILTGLPRNKGTESFRDFFIKNPHTQIANGESIAQSEERMREFLRSLPANTRVLAVTHGSGIKAAQTVLSGRREPTGDSALVAPGGIAGIFRGGSGLELRPLFKETTAHSS